MLDQTSKPIAEAVCTLTGGPLPDTCLSVTTGEKGEFSFTGLLPATYRLTCAAADYEPVMKQDLSLDLEMYKEFRISFLPWVLNHTLRGILRIYNVTNHYNPRDVYSNITSTYFGHFVGFQHRFYDTALNFLY